MRKIKKKEIILVIIFFTAIAFLNIKEFIYKTNGKLLIEESVNEDNETNQQDSISNENNEIVEPAEIKVDIWGAVKNPGLIVLKEGDRVEDAINKAGGLTENADTLRINQAEIVYDGKKIIIPEIGQDIYIEEVEAIGELGNGYKININTASKDELTKLSGIGEEISDRIIKYRKQNGDFKEIEDIMNVIGIGQSKFEQIKDCIKVK